MRTFSKNTFPISFADSPAIDAFGRLRTSQPETLFDSKQIFDSQALFWDDQEVSGGGTTSTHSVDKAESVLAVSATTAGKRVRQTFRWFNYQPGKSQRINMTCGNLNASSGNIKGFGYGNDDNGLFLISDGGTLKFVRRTKTSGTVVDNETEISTTLSDGTVVDLTKTQILDIDFEWLGVGRVRAGFIIGGDIKYYHEELNANNLDVVYMSTPNLPLRYWIENDGTGAADTFQAICSTVISEGGNEDTGIVRCVSTGGTHLDANVENTKYALIGIRLKSAYLGLTVKIINIALQLQTGSHQVLWELRFNPTVAGTFTYSDVSNSGLQSALGATANTVTGGIPINAAFIESGGNQAGNAGSTGAALQNALLLGSAIDGTRDEIVLCVQPVGGSTNVDVEGSIAWRELL